MLQPLIAIDTSQKITHINKTGADLFQKKPEDLIGTICHTLFQTDVCQGGNCATMRSIRERRVITEETVAHIGSKDIPILVTATPVINEEGVCTGAVEFKSVSARNNYGLLPGRFRLLSGLLTGN